ncbi:MAG: cell wall-binding repeat-containing protein [Acidimicrobiales bacterium]
MTPSSTPALALDAPDPDIVLADGVFYAFTTGTTWGNQIAIAKTTFSDPQMGWTTLNGQPSGSSAFAENGDAAPPAAWELNNTANSPGVFQYDGEWIMFYDAEQRSSGYYCISVATASTVTGPYADTSSGPLECQPSFGGSIDPQPFIDPATGVPYLLWKSNDGSSSQSSSVWSEPIASNGISLTGSPTAIFTIASDPYPWQSTTDDPSMAFAGGSYYLFFSGGNYLADSYSTGYVVCSGPSGLCDQNEPSDPILSGPGGAGGGTVFTDASGSWWISYQAWAPAGCTNYSCGGQREMSIAPISLPSSAAARPPPRTLPVQRIYGTDAIGTAIAVSQAEFPKPGSAKAVVLARSDFFTDALAGGPLAAQVGGPLLISPGASMSATLDPRVSTEIQRVLPVGGTVYVLGGDLALSADIDSALQAMGYRTLRIAGTDEFATAVDIAEQLGSPTTIFEATGLNFPDALSAVPAAIEDHGAILLTNGSSESLGTYAYIVEHPGDTRYAIGGPLAAAGADGGAMPVYGQDLYDTSAAVASTFFPHATVFGAATGFAFPDALSGGPFIGAQGVQGPILLVDPSLPLPPSIASYLAGDAALTSGYLFGGPLAVSNDVKAAL